MKYINILLLVLWPELPYRRCFMASIILSSAGRPTTHTHTYKFRFLFVNYLKITKIVNYNNNKCNTPVVCPRAIHVPFVYKSKYCARGVFHLKVVIILLLFFFWFIPFQNSSKVMHIFTQIAYFLWYSVRIINFYAIYCRLE